MSGKEDPEDLPEPLKDMREALASLAPRTERLHRERLMFLAGQASVSVPGAHSARTRVGRRWGWPAAFSAMSALAASLLVMLSVRPEPQVVVRVVERVVPVSVAPAAAESAPGAAQEQGKAPGDEASPGRERVPRDWLAWGALVVRPDRGSLGPSYPRLREQLLAHGVESWEYPAAPAAAPTGTSDSPLPYRDQLDRILQQQGWGGSWPRAPSRKVPNRSGGES
jgi:hypothetical protein